MKSCNWPIYFKDRLLIGNLSSRVAIITLWTPVEAFIPKVNQDLFSIAGQLYSQRGINFILRNIAANPIIDTILICGADLSKSGESLKSFINNGIKKDRSIIGFETAYIEEEITDDFITEFRKNVKIIDMIGNSSYQKINDALLPFLNTNQSQPRKSWYKETMFPDPPRGVNSKFPSEKATYVIRGNYIKDTWPQVLRHIMKFGSSKGMIKIGEVKELTNLVVVIEKENPNKPQIPDWFNFNLSDLNNYYKNFFSKETNGEDYNYGERIFKYSVGLPYHAYNSPNNPAFPNDTNNKNQSATKTKQLLDDINPQNENIFGIKLNQLEEVLIKLKRYKYDRGGVISLWNPWKDNISEGWMSDNKESKGGNVPCMTQIQFAYRSHALHITAYFRSNDMFDAWPRNTFALRKLQQIVADKLKMKMGTLTTISALAQVYEGNYKKAELLLEKFSNITNCRPDHRGNVLVEVEGEEIVVRHLDTSGNLVLEEFKVDGTKPKAAQKMTDILLTNLVFSEMPHAMDIARELQKAEIAIKNGLKFRQDRDLEMKKK